MSQTAVPLKIRISQAPQDAHLDYALYQVSLSLRPHAEIGSGAGTGAAPQQVMGSGPVSWVVLRRYSEFTALRDTLEADGLLSEVPGEEKLFPKKHALKSSKDSSVVRERLIKLPHWLVAVSRVPAASTHASFRSFLQLEQFEKELAQAAASLAPNADHTELEASSYGEGGTPRGSPRSPREGMSPSHILTGTAGGGATRTTTGRPASSMGQRDSPLPRSRMGGTTASGSVIQKSVEPLPSDGAGVITRAGAVKEASMVPNIRPPLDHGDPSLPRHAEAEYATARTEVELRLPRVPLPSERSPMPSAVIRTAQERMREVNAEEEQASRLREAAARHRKDASELSEAARVRSSTVQEAAAMADRLDREALQAEEGARELRRIALSQERALQELRESASNEAGKAERERAEATGLVKDAKTLEADAARKRAAAIAAHEQAAYELLQAEQRVHDGAANEEHRQVAEAAAAAARAHALVREAAKEKASEEAAIQSAHLAAAEEAEAIAQLAIAQHHVALANQRKSEAEARAQAYRERAHEHTQAAAQASAELDARSKAAGMAHSQAVRAEQLSSATRGAVERTHENVFHWHPETESPAAIGGHHAHSNLDRSPSKVVGRTVGHSGQVAVESAGSAPKGQVTIEPAGSAPKGQVAIEPAGSATVPRTAMQASGQSSSQTDSIRQGRQW